MENLCDFSASVATSAIQWNAAAAEISLDFLNASVDTRAPPLNPRVHFVSSSHFCQLLEPSSESQVFA